MREQTGKLSFAGMIILDPNFSIQSVGVATPKFQNWSAQKEGRKGERERQANRSDTWEVPRVVCPASGYLSQISDYSKDEDN